MYLFQNKSGPTSWGAASGNGGGSRNSSKDPEIKLIREANTVDLQKVFDHYNLELNEFNRKIVCPFPHHQDDTPSFYYYINEHEKSFYCFGCKVGGRAVEFVSEIENISKYDAAVKLTSEFETNISSIVISNVSEKRELMLNFSNHIRNFIQSDIDDDNRLAFAEQLTLVFDTLNTKHKLETEGVKSLISKLKIRLDKWQQH